MKIGGIFFNNDYEMKLTKRKGFSFMRSYFDVLNKLQSDEDKLSFLMAIINKQFLNEDPTDLKFPVDLAYDSQFNNIDSSVKGWIRANKTDLQGNSIDTPPTPPRGKTHTPPREEEVEEKEKEEEEVKDITKVNWEKLKNRFIELTGKNIRTVNSKTKKQINARLKEGYTKDDIDNAIKNCYNDDYHKETNHKYLTLEFISRADKLEKYATIKVKKEVEVAEHWNTDRLDIYGNEKEKS